MSDLIERKAAIDAINHICPVDTEYDCTLLDRVDVRYVLSDLPSADPGLDEWCTECKEYDQERHCCPRWNRVIRQTLKDAELERKKERWIPCSEQLPKKHQMVLTTIIGTDVIRMIPGETFEDALARVRNHVRVSVGYIEDDGWYGADGFPQIVTPVAWMPMPEPYREVVDD